MSKLLPLLFILAWIPSSVLARQHTPRPLSEAQQSKLESLRQDEGRRAQDGLDWAQTQGFPVLFTTPGGKTVEVVGLSDAGRPIVFTTHNRDAGAITRSHTLHPGGRLRFDLTGKAIAIGQWDSGPVREDHQELRGRIVAGDVGARSNHATHVAGTMIAGGADAQALGMAPKASVKTYNWNFHTSEMREEAEEGLLLSNHSYGRIAGWYMIRSGPESSRWYWFGDPNISTSEDFMFGHYDDDASTFDLITYANPYYLPVVSAGNERDDFGPATGPYLALDERGQWQEFDQSTRPIAGDGGGDGFDSITSFATAKNVLTVGSIGLREAGFIDASIFSSYGPTDDGRIKPDLVGYGETVYSSVASADDHYGRYTGTSMAAPNVAGSLALLQELATSILGHPIRSASLKGIALHTASDLGLPGPDYSYGWGLLDTESAARHLLESLEQPIRLIEDSLANGATYSYGLSISEPGPLRATIAWTDPAAMPIQAYDATLLNNRTPLLVNDLDIRITRKEDGEPYAPYVLNPDRPDQPATMGDNVRDPIEQIYIDQAPAGIYQIEITHKGSLANGSAQHFSLLLSGADELFNPVVISDLTQHVAADYIELVLGTLQESAQGTFEIERAQLTEESVTNPLSLQYNLASTLASQGPTSTGHTYTLRDPITVKGEYHYRWFFVDDVTGRRVLLAETEVERPAPEELGIVSNFPNPFQERTQVVFDLPEAGKVHLSVFDVLGRLVVTVVNEEKQAGRYTVDLDAHDWATGIYFARIQTPSGLASRRMVLMR